jgi:hypothetical protein
MCAFAVGLGMLNTAFAHGNHNAEHGGIVRVSGETTFELVTLEDAVELYVKEEGADFSSAGLSAKATVVNGTGEKSEVALAPAGGNKFAAKGVKIASGSRVAVQVTLADKQSKIGANFVVK